MLKNLKLSRPLAIFDLETTGTDPKEARIVEFTFKIFQPDGSYTLHTARVNPGIPIPPEASAVHGIFDVDVDDQPRFVDFASRIVFELTGADLAGFNVISYDLPVLLAEVNRAGCKLHLDGRKVVDVMRVYKARERRDLAAAYRFYTGLEHTGAHGATADVLATAAVLDAQVVHYEDLPTSFDELHAAVRDPAQVDLAGTFRREGDGEAIVFAIGKHRGRSLADTARIDPGYLRWMLGQDFMDDAKQLCRAALDGKLEEVGSAAGR